METSLWVRAMKGSRILRQETQPCAHEEVQAALETALDRMDLPKPLWLDKHHKDWAAFGQTRFLPEHFFESLPFDRLEIEFINPRKPRKQAERTFY